MPQMKALTFLFAAVFALFASRVQAQYRPDTTLTYETFLKQCQDFSKQPQQEVWVVNFWATWNGNSLNTLPGLKEVQSEYQNKPVRFVSISVDKSRKLWEAALPQYQLPWEQLLLAREADYGFMKRAFRHNSIPAVFIVNTRGQIFRVRDAEELRAELSSLAQDLPNRPWKPAALTDLRATETQNPTPRANVTPAKPATGSSSGTWITHTVQQGETLYAISRRYGVPVEQIKSANGIAGAGIRIGQTLKIKRRA